MQKLVLPLLHFDPGNCDWSSPRKPIYKTIPYMHSRCGDYNTSENVDIARPSSGDGRGSMEDSCPRMRPVPSVRFPGSEQMHTHPPVLDEAEAEAENGIKVKIPSFPPPRRALALMLKPDRPESGSETDSERCSRLRASKQTCCTQDGEAFFSGLNG